MLALLLITLIVLAYASIATASISTGRIAGYDRYETSLKIAREVGVNQRVFVTNDLNFANTLSIGPIAAALKMPIVLVLQIIYLLHKRLFRQD